MNKPLRKLLICVFSVLLIICTFTPANAKPPVVQPPKITTYEPLVCIETGTSRQLTYQITEGSLDSPVTWVLDSDTTGEIALGLDGTVYAGYSCGKAYIRAVVPGGDAALYEVYVCENPNQLATSYITYYLEPYESRQIYLLSEPDGGRFSKKTATSLNPSIVSVSEEPFGDDCFEITAGAVPGQGTVMVEAENGIYTLFNVVVVDGHIAYKINTEQQRHWMRPKAISGIGLRYQLEPEDSIDKVYWEMLSNETESVYFENDSAPTVWPLETPGYAKFAAVGYRTYTDCWIYVSDQGDSILPEAWKYTIPLGSEYRIPLHVDPYSARYCRKYIQNDDDDIFEVLNEDMFNGYTGMDYVDIRGVAEGSGVFTVQLDNGESIGIVVEVENVLADTIQTGMTEVFVPCGGYVELPYQIYPIDATEIPVFDFVGAPSDIITLTETGGVVGNAPGITNIYAEIANGERVYYTVHVYEDPLSAAFTQDTYYMCVGDTLPVQYETYPENGSFARFTVSVSDPYVISPNSDIVYGDPIEIYALQEGVSTITVTADNGISTTSEIHVFPPGALDPKADLILPEQAFPGVECQLGAAVQGGIAPYKYKFTAKVNGSWVTIPNPDNAPAVSYTFAETGSYPVCVSITDSNGKTDKSQKTLIVKDVEPLSADLILPEQALMGRQLQLRADVSGGVMPYTYKFTVKVDGNWIIIPNPNNIPEVTYTFPKTGSYPVCVNVKDSKGITKKSQKTLTVTQKKPLQAELEIPQTAEPGEEVLLKAEVSGGVMPYTYKFTAKVDGNWITIPNPDNQPEVSYEFTEAGSYPICVNVKDEDGISVKSQKTLIVKTSEPLSGILLSDADIRPGEETLLRAEASGGSGSYQYRYDVKENGSWHTVRKYSSDPELKHTFNETGIYPVCLYIKDSSGEVFKTQKKIYVADELTADLDKVNGAKVGIPVLLNMHGYGGIEPYTYKVTVKEGGEWVKKRGFTADSTYKWTPTEAGKISVCIYVKDAGGKTVKYQTKIQVSE